MTPRLHIRLLGEFRIDYGGTPLATIASARLQSLLAYLLLHRGVPQSRAHLAFQFWPDSSEAQAQANLRYFLHQLRRALPDAAQYIQADKTTLHWRADAPGSLDVADFEHAIAGAENGTSVDPAHALEQSIAHYGGDLLPSCYDDWIVPERERLRDLFLKALDRLRAAYEQRGDYAAAITGLQRLLRHDPLRESTYRHLMRLHALNGDRTGALRVYRTCVAVLRRELGVEPSPATRETYERLTQAESPDRSPSATRIAHAATLRHELPLQLTSFVGREREIADIRSLMSRTRLLTLTGAGGSGKTRLALALAAELVSAQAYADGVGWVELAAVSDPTFVPQAVATVLGLHEQPGQTLSEALTAHLRAKQFLLLLDNCEHLVDACAQLASILLRACPNLALIATSRQALGIAGETTWLVPPLSLPPGSTELPVSGTESDEASLIGQRTTSHRQDSALTAHAAAQNLMRSEAVSLFVERAAAALPTFHLSERNAGAVAQVCRRLDGVPLAIELAAARVKLLTVGQIAARLDDALRLLQGSSRTAPPRHQTLQAAIDWSHNLLSDQERALFRRLSVFAGGFTLEAAEVVCHDDGGRLATVGGRQMPSPLVHQNDVLDLLSRLIDQSLVSPMEWEQGAEARYRLLDTIRQYSRARLLGAGETEAFREQHAHYYMCLAEETSREFKGRDQVAWIARLEQENDNLRAALEWSLESRAVEVGLRLAGAVWRFWFARGYLSEGRQWLSRLLRLAGKPSYTQEYAAAAYGAGVIAWRQGDHAAARALGEESLAIFQTLEDGEGIGLSLVALANVSGAQGDYGAQRAHLEESLALFRELGDKSGAAGSLNNLGELARYQGDHARAKHYYAESLTLYQELGNANGTALVLHNLGHVAQHEGDNRRAASLFSNSLATYQALGHRGGIAMCLASAAGLAAAQGQPVRVARLFGAAESTRQAVGTTMDGADRVAHDRYVAAVRRQLGEEAFAAAWAEGRAMNLDQAVADALTALQGDSGQANSLSPPARGLG